MGTHSLLGFAELAGRREVLDLKKTILKHVLHNNQRLGNGLGKPGG